MDAAAEDLIDFLRAHVDLNGAHWRLPESMRSPSPAKFIRFSECLLRWMTAWYACLEKHVPKADRKSPTVDPRITAMYQKLREADFTRTLPESRLAKEAGMSRAHFKRLFKEAYGTSARQVREDVRRRYVSNRLRETDQPLKQIAIDAGFSSPAAFTKWFQRVIGVTPSGFRQQFTREA